MTHSKKGYSLKILQTKTHPEFLCVLCNLILRNPAQGSCGHRFCKGCIDDYLSSNDKILCQACKEENTIEDCSFLQFNQIFPDNGKRRELNVLPVKCPNDPCDWTGQLKVFVTHEKECPRQVIKVTQAANDILQAAITDATRPFESGLADVELLVKDTRSAKENVAREVLELQNQIQAIERSAEEYKNKETSFNIRQDLQSLKDKTQTFEDATDILQQKSETACVLMEDLKQWLCQAETTIVEQEQTIQNLVPKLAAAETLAVAKVGAVAAMNIRLQQLELDNFDGTLLWNITNLKKRHQAAVNGTNTNFYSPCFFTRRQGYKMCAQIYLNGDGIGHGTHISLLFVVMRGENDAVLTWPFRQKVSFVLMDKNGKEHIIDTLQPDPESPSFKRPTSEMNMASGCPLFLALGHLETDTDNFIQEDTLFVKIVVDTHDLIPVCS